MKKHLKKLYLFLLLGVLSIDNTYAVTVSFEFNFQNIITILCILLVILGLSLIIVGKISEKNVRTFKHDIDPDDHEIVGLKDVTKIDRTFSSDSIFKEIPTFSNKNFYETTCEELKKKLLKKDNELKEITIQDKNIVDFEITEKKYIITSEITVDEKKEVDKDRYTYIVKSEKAKETNEETETKKKTTNCPNCGGKVKDANLKRCLHCGFSLEKEKLPQSWKITKIEKMD